MNDEYLEKQMYYDVDEKEQDKLSFEKILKSNSIIHGRFPEIETTKLYASDFKNINFLYRLLQNLVRQEEIPPRGAVTIRFPLDLFRLIMDNQSKWKQYFISSIMRLENTKFELKNYYDEFKKEKIHYQSTQLLAFPKFFTNYNEKLEQVQRIASYDEKTNKINILTKGIEYLEITFPNEIAVACWQKGTSGGYTHINIKQVNELQNKFSIRLYEVLLSKIQLDISKGEIQEKIVLSKNELSDIFTKKIDKKLNLNSYLLNNVNFKTAVLPELQEKLPIVDYDVNQKDFSITFSLNIDTLNQLATSKKTPYELALEQFDNLIDADVFKQEYQKGYVDANSTLYVVKGEKINEALNNFLLVLNEKYFNQELLNTDEEKIKFGNVIMKQGVGFINKDNDELLNKPNRVKFLRYLYTNHYVDIMSNIIAKEKADETQSNKSSIAFGLFINKIVKISEKNHAKIKQIQQFDDKIKVIFSLYQANDENQNEILEMENNFDNLNALIKYLENNKI